VLQFGAFLEDPRCQEPLAVCLGKSDGQLVDLGTKKKVKDIYRTGTNVYVFQ
jgi:hypothetical protein